MEKSNEHRVEYEVQGKIKNKVGYVLNLYETYAYAKTREGLEKAIKRFGIEVIVENLNAQLKTRARNDAARPSKAPAVKEARKLRKSLPREEQEEFDKELFAFLANRKTTA